jgi:hypothetical protein
MSLTHRGSSQTVDYLREIWPDEAKLIAVEEDDELLGASCDTIEIVGVSTRLLSYSVL